MTLLSLRVLEGSALSTRPVAIAFVYVVDPN